MKIKRRKLGEYVVLALVGTFIGVGLFYAQSAPQTAPAKGDGKEITWVDFNVSYQALQEAMALDIASTEQEVHINWVDALAYLGAKYGGNFDAYKSKDLEAFGEKLRNGQELDDFTHNMKFFSYYKKAYGAVLNGMVGAYKEQVPTERGTVWKEKYGLKAYSPIAAGYWYGQSDDFGNSRNYGYSRKHFGHDLMLGTGTPVISVESGTVEAMGWNQYGGWRLGIRTFDKKRYYYYAHLRKDHPYSENLHVGKTVTAGEVIGYTGQTGYSVKENVNNIQTPHLHYGMQLIFDEKAKDSPNQVWIDLYPLTRLLAKHTSEVYKDGEEYYRKYGFSEDNYYLAATRAVDGMQVAVPIIMYHSLLEHPNTPTDYIISPKQFEDDLRYLRKQGYTSIFVSDLIKYVDKGIPLPKKPILLTFDDGNYNNFHYGLPLLERYQAKAVLSIVGKYTEKATKTGDVNPNYSYLTWKQVHQMSLSGAVEFQNHSWNAHDNSGARRGILQKSGESDEDYAKFLKTDLLEMQRRTAEMTGIKLTAFSYPFGAVSHNATKIVKSLGFRASFGCEEGGNTITKGDVDCLYNLKRYLRSPKQSSRQFFRSISVL